MSLRPGSRSARVEYIASLDPALDHVRIVYLMAGLEFPWDMTRALELALFRTFCSPRISRLLHATGEFRKRGQKRYDDTALLMAELIQWGYDSPRGRASLARINAMHGRYRIPNEDYLYVLSTFVLDPIRWIDVHGWRPLLEVERQALFHFFRAVGQRMHVEDIPATLDELARFAKDYERRYFVYADSNRQVADATMRIVADWLPPGVKKLVIPTVNALLDERMRQALGYEQPHDAWVQAVRAVLGARKHVVRLLPARRVPFFSTAAPARTYPDGYRIEELGVTFDARPEHRDPP